MADAGWSRVHILTIERSTARCHSEGAFSPQARHDRGISQPTTKGSHRLRWRANWCAVADPFLLPFLFLIRRWQIPRSHLAYGETAPSE